MKKIFKVTNPADPKSRPQRVDAIDLEDAIRQMAEEWAGEDGPDYAFAKSLKYEQM